MQIKQQFIPKSRTKQRPGIVMTPKYLTIHSTGNPNSTAQNEADFVCKNSTRQASYHFVCDDKQVIQILPTNEVAWHAGDGGKGAGNRQSIGIEICESGDRRAAVDNAIWLTKELMRNLKILASRIVQHNHWSGKNCPRILRDKNFIKDGIDWDYFLWKVNLPEGSEEEMTQEQFNQMMDAWLASRAELAPDAWSEEDRQWAESAGIVQGDESGRKKYKALLTKEEAVAMLHRALEK